MRETTTGTGASEEQRRDPRVPVRSEVRITYPDLGRLAKEICGNVSVGGMFVEMPVPPPVGAEVTFELDLPGRGRTRTVRGEGEVVWRRESPGPDRPAGCGIRFRQLDARFRELVFTVVDRFIQRGGQPFDLDPA